MILGPQIKKSNQLIGHYYDIWGNLKMDYTLDSTYYINLKFLECENGILSM